MGGEGVMGVEGGYVERARDHSFGSGGRMMFGTTLGSEEEVVFDNEFDNEFDNSILLSSATVVGS